MVISQRIPWSGRAAMLGGVRGTMVTPVLTFAGWMASGLCSAGHGVGGSLLIRDTNRCLA